MAQATRENLSVALVLLDLDDCKHINDELGHPVGDQVLRIVAARRIAATRGADTACRYGGDEFVVMLPQVEDSRMADAVASKFKTAITAPIAVDNCEITLTASAGCVLYTDDGTTCAELIEVADQRLYRDKASRSNVAIHCTPDRMGGY
jgi:diguanylate cyclase (GGDEF)-like protein